MACFAKEKNLQDSFLTSFSTTAVNWKTEMHSNSALLQLQRANIDSVTKQPHLLS